VAGRILAYLRRSKIKEPWKFEIPIDLAKPLPTKLSIACHVS
jgi:hypothetical protein